MNNKLYRAKNNYFIARTLLKRQQVFSVRDAHLHVIKGTQGS